MPRNSPAQGKVPKALSSWRIFDLLKTQSSPKPAPASPHFADSSVSKCACCGTVLVYEDGAAKFRCALCHTTNVLHPDPPPELPEVSFAHVKRLVDQCMAGKPQSRHALHELLGPVLHYLLQAFGLSALLNRLFRVKPLRRAHYSTSNLDLQDVRRLFDFLLRLPLKRPLYGALLGASTALRRLPLAFFADPQEMYWVVILFEIPCLLRAFMNSDKRSLTRPRSMCDVPEIQALCYDIVKRVLGIFAQAEATSSGNYLASWFSKLPYGNFLAKVELINLYITFHLKKYFYLANNPSLARRSSQPEKAPKQPVDRAASTSARHDDEYFQYSFLKDEVECLDTPLHFQIAGTIGIPRRKRKDNTLIRVHQYLNNYHLRTAAAALNLFVKANYIRSEAVKLPMHAFYNSLVDYVNVKLDFDTWLSRKKQAETLPGMEPDIQTLYDYIHSGGLGIDLDESAKLTFYFCQFPFLISLGSKISVLEKETRRQMGRKAEEAFIDSLNRHERQSIYFNVLVRRDHIVNDSLRCIQLNPGNLKKSLKVKFVNEPGIDAGGPTKEWLLLLARALFSPIAGMFYNVEDLNYLWFNVKPKENAEMYYLLGVVLGLAIYNSTILELKFPIALYKLLLNMPVGLADYQDLFPVAARNLFKLREYSSEELRALDLTFEVLWTDAFGAHQETELCPDGASTRVNTRNRERYIDMYARFFLVDGMQQHLQLLKSGFSSVVDNNAFALFSPEELRLLLCGSNELNFDVDVLRLVTKYIGWKTKEEACACPAVQWLWEYIGGLTFPQQRRFLSFVTGSDRVPATGIQNLLLKICRLCNGEDLERLPVAHTCFNQLSIYEYKSREKMIDKLDKAVSMSLGFGIK